MRSSPVKTKHVDKVIRKEWQVRVGEALYDAIIEWRVIFSDPEDEFLRFLIESEGSGKMRYDRTPDICAFFYFFSGRFKYKVRSWKKLVALMDELDIAPTCACQKDQH